MLNESGGQTAPLHVARARQVPGRPLSSAQQKTLSALFVLCPLTGQQVAISAIAEQANMKPNAVKLALGALDDRGLARPDDDGAAEWWPTWAGRERAKALREAQTAAA